MPVAQVADTGTLETLGAFSYSVPDKDTSLR